MKESPFANDLRGRAVGKKMTEESRYDRRQFLGAAAMTVAATQLRVGLEAGAALTRVKSPLSNSSFGPVKQIQAGLLNVGYVETGPAGGPPVILLHGWPYDIHTYVDVAPILAAKGFRVIVPYLRGYGTTRFLSSETLRNGQQSVIARRHRGLDGCAQNREGDSRRV